MSSKTNVGIGGVHDLGGSTVPDSDMSIDQHDPSLSYWERSIHALLALLSTKSPRLLTTDELRRAVESLEPEVYHSWGYYEKWAVAIAKIMLERQVITQDELDFELNGDSSFPLNSSGEIPILFKEGDIIRIRSESTRLTWRKPHLRCPGYIFGLIGKVNKVIGTFEDPYLLAFRGTGPKQPLYSVSFPMTSVWASSNCALSSCCDHPAVHKESLTEFNTAYNESDDVIEADVYQEWMVPCPRETLVKISSATESDHGHSHTHTSTDACCGGHSDAHSHEHHKVHFDPHEEKDLSAKEHNFHSYPHSQQLTRSPSGGGGDVAAVEWNHHTDLIRIDSFREVAAPFHHPKVEDGDEEESAATSVEHDHSHDHRRANDAQKESVEPASAHTSRIHHDHNAESVPVADAPPRAHHASNAESTEEAHSHAHAHHHVNFQTESLEAPHHTGKVHNVKTNAESNLASEPHRLTGKSHLANTNAESVDAKPVHEEGKKHFDEHGLPVPPVTDSAAASLFPTPPTHCITQPANNSNHDHDHSHDHGHTHEGRYEVECTALSREGDVDRAGQVVGEALLRALYKKGVVSADEIRACIERLDSAGVNMVGADLVVRCWRNPAFQERLVNDAPTAAREMGLETSNPNAPTVLRVYANTDHMHNIVVCTLCSCYPFKLLGYSPAWYKSRSYRARTVREPRKVLAEFGTILPESTRIRVLDSTADCRYLVIPQLPKALRADPEGVQRMSDAELRALVTRDSMIGVTVL